MKPGSLVVFRHPFADEIDMTYRVMEERGDRILIQAMVNLPYPPSQTVLRSDLKPVAGK